MDEKSGVTQAMGAWYVYIVRCADNSLYTGVAKNIQARLAQHNAGTGAKYTRSRCPVILVYTETAVDHGAALRKEYALKRLTPAAKRALIKPANSAVQDAQAPQAQE